MSMRKIYLFVAGLLLGGTAWAQSPTWASDVAPIMYENCTRCHATNGVGPFTIESYQDAYDNRFAIQFYVNNGIMPPWPPDPDYQHYAMERALTDSEVATIDAWVNAGSPRGDSTLEPVSPHYPELILGQGDLEMTMPTYTSQAQSYDDYMCVALDPQLTSDRVIRAMEIIPGNREAVHHVLVYLVDSASGYVGGNIYPGCTDPGGRLLGGYAPGGGPQQFPDGSTKMGMTIHPGDKIVFAMHYPEGSFGQEDSTRINLHFYPPNTQGVREVLADPIFESWNFCIQPNNEQTLTQTYPAFGVITTDFSLLSIFPHNHLLGKSWHVYGIDGNLDTIPLIKIPKWDFEWQGFYFFDYIKKLPFGSRMFAEAVYDNTTANPWNPNSPPQLVCAGLNTSDEMFLCYFHYLPYEPGDELISMDSLLVLPVAVNPRQTPTDLELQAFPNPFNQFTSIEYVVTDKQEVQIEILDLNGKQVRKVWHGKQGKGTYRMIWRGQNAQGNPVPAGYYLARVRVGELEKSIRLLKVD